MNKTDRPYWVMRIVGVILMCIPAIYYLFNQGN